MVCDDVAHCASPQHCLCRPDVGSVHGTMECEENQHAVGHAVQRLQATLRIMVLTDMMRSAKDSQKKILPPNKQTASQELSLQTGSGNEERKSGKLV